MKIFNPNILSSISSSFLTASLYGTASWSITSSYISPTFISASAAASGFGSGGSTNTGSLLTTASVSLNTITFTKGDGSTFPIVVNTGSGGGLTRQGLSLYTIKSDFPIFIGDGKAYATIPSASSGLNLVDAQSTIFASSSLGSVQVQVARGRQSSPSSSHSYVDMLSTLMTIDVSEYDSINGAVQRVIDTNNDDVLAGDVIRVDVDASGSNAQGLLVRLTFG